MAKYSFSVYGPGVKYGEIENNRAYYNAQLNAWCYDYQKISLTWTSVSTDPADIYKPTHWKITKSYTGTADSPYEGEFVDGDVITSFRLSYVDSEPLENAQVLYTFWLFNGEKWINCGSSSVIVVYDSGTLEKIEKWIPAAWLNEVGGIGDAIGEVEQTTLTKVLSGYAFEYDRLRAEANLLELTGASAFAPSELLPSKVTELGFNYEPALGDSYHRTLYRSGNIINSLKGTVSGISQYVTALTHFTNEVTVGHNLMLDYNDSSFEENAGRWSASTGTFDRHTYADSLAVLGVAVTPPQLDLAYDILYPPRTVAFGSYNGHNHTASTLSLPGPSQSVITYGIPVKPNTRYIFFGRTKVLDAAKDGKVKAKIKWYTSNGTLISDTGYGPELTLTASGIEFVSPSDSARNGKLSPATAAYAGLEILATPNHTQTHFLFDMFQFCEPQYSLEYQDARKVIITVHGEKENYIQNPSFEQGTGGWITLNSTLVQDTNAPASAIVYGNAGRTVTRTVTGNIDEATLTISPNSNGVVPNQTIAGVGIGALAKINSITGNTLNLTVKNIDAVNETVTLKTGSVGKVTAVNTGVAAVVSEWIPVNPSTNLYFSAYVSGAVGRTAKVRCEYSSLQSASEQTSVFTDEDGQYYPTETYYVDSDTITITADAQRLSVSSVSPAYSKDAGDPSVKVSIIFTDAVAADEFYIDGVLLDEAQDLDSYFDGNGAPLPSDPLQNTFFNLSDCLWAYDKRINFFSNPSFTSTSDWTEGSGTTFTVESSGTSGITSLYGPNHGKVSKSGGGAITGTAYLPEAAIGGEDAVVSVYVKNKVGTYTISTNGQASSSFYINDDNRDQWIRLHTKRTLQPGETSFDVTISLSTGNGSAAVFYVDGAQAEYGTVPTAFLDINDSGVVQKTNPLTTSKTITLGITQNDSGAASSYWANAGLKFSRLYDTLPLVLPLGSSWCIKTGVPTKPLDELRESLIPSASFEWSIDGWNTNASTLARHTAQGTLFNDVTTQGGSYGIVEATAASNFGIHTNHISVFGGSGYYASVAIKPENSDAYGDYTLSVKFYDVDNIMILDKNITQAISHDSRWAYLGVNATGLQTIGAVYAVVTVTAAPTTPAIGATFYVDRAVFRE